MNQQLDPVNTMVVLLSLVLSPALASAIGPYAVIIVAATTGAAWSLSRRDRTSNLSAFWYFARLNLTACVLTVSLAMMCRHWGMPVDPQWLMAPIAIVIGGVGDAWPAVGQFIVERLGRLVDRKIDNVGPSRDEAGTKDYSRTAVDERGFRTRDNGDA